MTLYIAREAVKLWRKIAMETCVELQVLLENWKLLLAGLIFQEPVAEVRRRRRRQVSAVRRRRRGYLAAKASSTTEIGDFGESWSEKERNGAGRMNETNAKIRLNKSGSLNWTVSRGRTNRAIAPRTLRRPHKTVARWSAPRPEYVHGVAAHGIHYLHRPGHILHDLGFYLLPELGPDKAYVSETFFSVIFFSFILWTFHPFFYHSKRFYTVLLWRKVLVILVTCQALRIITFYSTHLPGPNYHCREGSEYSTLAPPERILDLFLINVRGVFYGCGDLIFSSHMIFTLVFVLTYCKYGSKRFIKILAWLIAVVQSLLIIASRKHYSVDVVVAWYTTNLVVYFIDTKLTEMPERTNGSQPFLPLLAKEKEDKSKEETHKLLNGNSVETLDWRYRSQTNGKQIENGNHVHPEAGKNGRQIADASQI